MFHSVTKMPVTNKPVTPFFITQTIYIQQLFWLSFFFLFVVTGAVFSASACVGSEFRPTD